MNRNYLAYLICFLFIPAQYSIADNITPSSTKETKNVVSSELIDDSAAGWIYNGVNPYDDPNFKNGTSHAGGPGSYAAFTFAGTSVDIFGLCAPAIKIDGRTRRLGRVKVSIDGKAVTETSLQSKEVVYDFNIASITGLKKGNHVLQVEPLEGWIVVDYIVLNSKPDQLSTSEKRNIKAAIVDQIIPEGDYYLSPKNAPDKFLETATGETSNNTKLQIYTYASNHMQIWHVSQLDNGFYKISPNANPDAAVTFGPKGQVVILWEFGNYPSQMLAIVSKSQGYYEVRVSGSSKLGLDVAYTRNENGTAVDCFEIWGNDGQLWRFIPVESK